MLKLVTSSADVYKVVGTTQNSEGTVYHCVELIWSHPLKTFVTSGCTTVFDVKEKYVVFVGPNDTLINAFIDRVCK